ncbi:hypothetical protein D3C87_1916010 [compost metagenome]
MRCKRAGLAVSCPKMVLAASLLPVGLSLRKSRFSAGKKTLARLSFIQRLTPVRVEGSWTVTR